jgi:hypothetical protein
MLARVARLPALSAMLALFVIGCSAPTPPRRPTFPRTKIRAERPVEVPCPLGVPDASILAEDSEDGIAVTLVSLEHTAELRLRAEGAARMHGPLTHGGLGHDGRHGQGHQHGLHAGLWPPAVARVTDVPAGARLDIVPVDGINRDRLRAVVHARVVEIASTACDER